MKILYFKKILGIMLISFFSTGMVFADNFCNGYNEGYKSGYRKAIGIQGLDPMVPMCPIQPISEFENAQRDHNKGYEQGYNEGFTKGKEEDKQQHNTEMITIFLPLSSLQFRHKY